jgi:hypothetical protein
MAWHRWTVLKQGIGDGNGNRIRLAVAVVCRDILLRIHGSSLIDAWIICGGNVVGYGDHGNRVGRSYSIVADGGESSMSARLDMAHDAGYRDDEARMVAEMLEHEEFMRNLDVRDE